MDIFGALLSNGVGAKAVRGSLSRPKGQANKQQTQRELDAEICRTHIAALAAGGMLTGGLAGSAAGTAACGAAAVTAPVAPLCGTIGGMFGASAGALGGAMTALTTNTCREGVVKKGRQTVPVPPMPPSLPNCPTHGVAHSCASNPTPSRGSSSRGARALPTAGQCSGGSCGLGSCGCR